MDSDLVATVMDQLNELSARITAFDGVFRSLDGLSETAPAIGRRVKGSMGLLSAVFDEQCSLLLAGSIGRRLKAVAHRPDHFCDVYRSVLATRETMTQKPGWAAVLDKYPAILSPIDRFLYIYRCPACGPDPTDNCAGDNMRAALRQMDAQIAWFRSGNCLYQRQVHECLLQLSDWLRIRLRPGLPWHDLTQRMADRYAQLDVWSRVCCSAVYAAAWRIMEAGVYADSTAAGMFLLHPNTQHGRYLHSSFLRNFGQLRAAYLSGAVTWEKFALILQAMDAQISACAAHAPEEAATIGRAARRYKRLLKVFARSFDTDALYLRTSQAVQQEADIAASLPRLRAFRPRETDKEAEEAGEESNNEDDDSDSPILELRRYLADHPSNATPPGGQRGWPGRRQDGGDGDGVGDIDQQRQQPGDVNEVGGGSSGDLRTLRFLRTITQDRLARLLAPGDTLMPLLLRLEQHLGLVLDCLDDLPRAGDQQLTPEQRARRSGIAADANLLLGALARLMRLAAAGHRDARDAI